MSSTTSSTSSSSSSSSSSVKSVTGVSELIWLARQVLNTTNEIPEKKEFLKGIARKILQEAVNDLDSELSDVAGIAEESERPSVTRDLYHSPAAAPAPSPSATSASGSAEPPLPSREPTPRATPVSEYHQSCPPDREHHTATDGEAASAFTGATASKRDFTRWCAARRLTHGHTFYLTGGGQQKQAFKLCWQTVNGSNGRRALLETTCTDGKILRANTPSGILRAYFKNSKNKTDWKGDAWSRLAMRSTGGVLWNLKDPNWEKYQWTDNGWVNVVEEQEGGAERR